MVEENTASFLEQVKAERVANEKVRDEINAAVTKMQELRAVEILSGTTSAGVAPVPKVEKSAVDYSKDALKGIV
jgi:hypothetical protein